MNVFSLARECFNTPEKYALVAVRAQTYVSLYERSSIDREEYFNLITDLMNDDETKRLFQNENRLALSIFFDKLKKTPK
jgi:hypothetical protein